MNGDVLSLIGTITSTIGVVLAAWIAQRAHRTGRKVEEFYERWSSNGD